MKASKYRNKRCSYGGHNFASLRERDYAISLDALKSSRLAGWKVERWTPQVRIPLVVNGQKIGVYIADFEVQYSNGNTEWHEVKGFETPLWRLKRKLMAALYPDRPIVVIK